MKKKLIMMILAGVLVFGMAGCGSDEPDSNLPDGGDQIEDMENPDGDATDESDEENAEDGEQNADENESDASGGSDGSEGTGGNGSQGSGQTPAQKPVSGGSTGGSTSSGGSTNSGNSGSSGTTSGGGSQAPDSAAGGSQSSLTLEDAISKSYGSLELPDVGETEITAENAEWFLGATDIPYVRALASEALISAVPHSVVAIQVEEGADIAAIEKKVKESANPRKWVCVEPQGVEVSHKGNIILLVMSDQAKDIIANFNAI